MGSTPGSGRSSGGRNRNPLQYSCLKNSVDRGAWQATVHGVAKGWTRPNYWAHTRMKNNQLKWIKAKAWKKSARRYGRPGERLRWPRHYRVSHNLGEVYQQNNVPPEFQPHLDVIKLLMTYHWQMFFCQTTRMNLLVHSSTCFACFPIYTCVPLSSVLTLAGCDFLTRNLSHLKIMSKQILLFFTKNEFCYCINQG